VTADDDVRLAAQQTSIIGNGEKLLEFSFRRWYRICRKLNLGGILGLAIVMDE